MVLTPIYCMAFVFATVMPAQAQNKATISHMSRVINGDDRLTAGRREQVVATISKVMARFPNMADDKVKYSEQHFSEYMAEFLDGNELYSDEEFGVKLEVLEWSLSNYAKMPPISDHDRTVAKRAFAGLLNSLAEFINESYADTPNEVREDLVKKVRYEFGSMERHIGNYFYPKCLYPPRTMPSSDEVKEMYQKSPFMEGNGDKFRLIASTYNDKGLPEATRKFHADHFLNHEASQLLINTNLIIRKYFDLSRATGYSNMPEELCAKINRITQAISERAEERLAEQLQIFSIYDILKCADYSVIEDICIPGEEYLPDLKDANASTQVLVLPSIGDSLPNNEKCVLDLRRNCLVAIPGKEVNTLNVADALERISMSRTGNVAWNGSLFTFGDTCVENLPRCKTPLNMTAL
jgi:hypothetical protein